MYTVSFDNNGFSCEINSYAYNRFDAKNFRKLENAKSKAKSWQRMLDNQAKKMIKNGAMTEYDYDYMGMIVIRDSEDNNIDYLD